MKAVLVAALLMAAGVSAAGPKWDALESYSFEQYQVDFQKSYTVGTPEHTMRKDLFVAKLKDIKSHNAAGNSWKKGVNTFTDQTAAELKSLRGALPRRAVTAKLTAKAEQHKITGKAIPTSVDWRTARPSVLTAVKDQGQCGSCWAHAATEGVETMMALKHNKLFVLSQQQLTSCVQNPNKCGGNGGCMGATAELAYDYIAANGGITEEWMMGYESYFGNVPACSYNATKTKPFVQISGYTHLPHNDRVAVMDAVANVGPLAISVDASHWSDYESGIFTGCDYNNNITMDHAVQLVGYGHDRELGRDYWLVRNSWSATFGEEGYIRLNREQGLPKCGWDNQWITMGGGCTGEQDSVWSCGQCGILYDTLYPNVV